LLKARLFAGLLVAFMFLPGAVLAEDSYAMAVSLYGAKRYAESEKLLSKHVASNPGNADAHYYLASCYHYQHKFEEAKKEYEYIVKNFAGTQAATYAEQALTSFKPASTASTKASAAAGEEGSSSDFIPDEERIPYSRGPGGHFYVKAAINGHMQEMMLDTGAMVTCLNSTQWRQLGLPLPHRAYDSAIQGVGGQVGTWIEDADITLGKIKRRIKVHVADSPTAPPLLGESFFGDLEFNMDSRAGYIHFFKKGHSASANAIPYNSIDIPFHRVGTNMVVEAKINGNSIECFFDTGAFGVLLGMNHIMQLGIHFPAETRVGSSGGVGGSMTTYFFPVDTIEVGGLKKTNFNIAVSKTPQMMPLLGQSFFGDRKYVIDNDKMLIRFAR